MACSLHFDSTREGGKGGTESTLLAVRPAGPLPERPFVKFGPARALAAAGSAVVLNGFGKPGGERAPALKDQNDLALGLRAEFIDCLFDGFLRHERRAGLDRNFVRELGSYGCKTQMRVVRLLAPRIENESHTKDIDFSAWGIGARREAGYAATWRALWSGEFDPIEGVISSQGHGASKCSE